MQLSGHKNIQSLSAYKSASLSHQRQMSDTLSRQKDPANASTSQINSGRIQRQFCEVSFSFFHSEQCNLRELFIELERPGSCLCWCKYFFHNRVHIPNHDRAGSIGLLQLAVTWYKIRHAGEQAYYYSRTGTSKTKKIQI